MKLSYRLRGALETAAPWLCLVGTLGLASYLHHNGGDRGQIGRLNNRLRSTVQIHARGEANH